MTKLYTLIQHKIFLPFFVLIGAGAGYIYWKQIGCLTGTCPMSANPFMNILTGAAIAYLLVSTLQQALKKQ